jgi:MFS family permease
VKSRTRAWVLALTSIASLMVALDTLVVSTALTTIRYDLDASVEELEWTVNAYNVAAGALMVQPRGVRPHRAVPAGPSARWR